MANKAPTPPRAAQLDQGTPGRVRAALSKARPAASAKTAPRPTPPSIPGEKKRGRPKKGPAELSMHPDAVRAREARAARAVRAERILTPPEARPAEGDTMLPASAIPSAPAMTGTIHDPAPLLAPEIRTRSIKNLSGCIKGIGILAALFYGEECKVSNDDALNTAELLLDGWPELAHEMGDAAKGLAVMAVAGLVGEKVQAVRERKARDVRTGGRLAPPAPSSSPPVPQPIGGGMAPQTYPPAST